MTSTTSLRSNPFSFMLAAFAPRQFVGRHEQREIILTGVTAAEPS